MNEISKICSSRVRIKTMVKINQFIIKKNVSLVVLLLSVLFICTCATSTQNNTTSQNSMKTYLKGLAGTKAPQKARQLEDFKAIKINTTMRDIFLIVGTPDDEVGSGLFIFVYNLDDSTKVWIGTTSLDSTPLYITHILKDGTRIQLLKK